MKAKPKRGGVAALRRKQGRRGKVVKAMGSKEILDDASKLIAGLKGHRFELLELGRPPTPQFAFEFLKLVSKLSPMLGNLLEYRVVEHLNESITYPIAGKWERQDPGFPDAIFRASIESPPGFEIKAWFPLATEITGRFRESQKRLQGAHINVVLLAWLPENFVFGQPRVIDVALFPGLSVAKARDRHYQNLPDYLVREPEDTTARTVNLQQTNTLGFTLQGGDAVRQRALKYMAEVGLDANTYSVEDEFQAKLRALESKFKYRGDTNFAKIDRIEHDGIEKFKAQVLAMKFKGKSLSDWRTLLNRAKSKAGEAALLKALADVIK